MLKRRTPMKRGGFARPTFERAPKAPARPLERPPRYERCEDDPSPVLKENAQRSRPYLMLVAKLPCCLCGRVGRSQAAHADEGKGMGLKSDDRTAFPLCATEPGSPGCHDRMGTLGAYTREQRRALEKEFGAKTRATIVAQGLWPRGLPLWEEVSACTS